ncbi:MAG TPA: galactokinase [Candidatus Acidoferrales bacterium]|nr:galactokinase [Candidatus Acidoferrales bacterium]
MAAEARRARQGMPCPYGMDVRESMNTVGELKSRFRAKYGEEPVVYRAPGRVNLIGEHTDYNDGFVFPAAIDLFTYVAIAPRTDRVIRVHSENFGEDLDFALDGTPENVPAGWARYVLGVALILERQGHALKGANLLIRGEVPIGAGVSSSAAVEVAAGYSLLANSGFRLEGRTLARICQRAENEVVGTRSGIMDQLASACGVAGRALLVDCRSLEFRALPLPAGIRLVICNTMVKRELAASAYNTRRAECEEGVRVLVQRYPEIRALRDATMEQLESCRVEMPGNVFRRCRHVISENARVLEAAQALEQGRLSDLRRAMAESHRSLRDDYEVSCAELDLLVERANREPGVHGARMTGAGFGGCTINLVEAEAVQAFRDHVASGYEQRMRVKPDIYVCSAADGVKQID